MKIAVIGLGYVGLPLACEFAKYYSTVGYDIDENRIATLKCGVDINDDIEKTKLMDGAENLLFTSSKEDLIDVDVYIIALPTPVNEEHRPDLRFLKTASHLVGGFLKQNNIVVYESTVYPGVTEDVCIPILEEVSGLKCNEGFGVGYSPERLSPGDKTKRVTDIVKVTSGSNAHYAGIIDALYKRIIKAGTFLAKDIKTAEAAKVIENTQRDLNIALMNQLSQLFSLLGIDTLDVLEAASTKWNFLDFKPGLVGGHCIGVDPYYLCHKAETVGYIPDIIVAGRRLNETMAAFVSTETIKLLLNARINLSVAKVLIVGYAFKENCSDVRNTKVKDIIAELNSFNIRPSIYDPLVDPVHFNNLKGAEYISNCEDRDFDFVILAVPHAKVLENWGEITKCLKVDKSMVFDLKGALPKSESKKRL